MAKFSGNIGFEKQVTSMGITKKVINERFAKGDFLNEVWRHNQGPKINDDITVTNRISILADQYFNDNKHSMIYVVIDGIPWRISTIEVQRPKLILNVGRLYNGKRPDPEE